MLPRSQLHVIADRLGLPPDMPGRINIYIVLITSFWRQNDATASFWCHHDVIVMSWVQLNIFWMEMVVMMVMVMRRWRRGVGAVGDVDTKDDQHNHCHRYHCVVSAFQYVIGGDVGDEDNGVLLMLLLLLSIISIISSRSSRSCWDVKYFEYAFTVQVSKMTHFECWLIWDSPSLTATSSDPDEMLASKEPECVIGILKKNRDIKSDYEWSSRVI